MSNYVKAVNFAAKDALITGDPNKKAKGTEVDTEFNAIATMSGTKEDSTNKGAISGYAALDVNQIVQGAGLNATGTTIPANGVYLPAANTLGFATATTQRATINATGNFVHLAPTAGVAVTATAFTGVGNFALSLVTTGVSDIAQLVSAPALGLAAIQFNTAAVITGSIGTVGTAAQIVTGSIAGDMVFRVAASSGGFRFTANGGTSSALTIANSGATTITSVGAAALTLNGGANPAFNVVTTTVRGSGNCNWAFSDPTGLKAQLGYAAAADDFYVSNELSGQLILRTAGAARLTIAAAGNVAIAAPTSGPALALTGVSNSTVLALTSVGLANSFTVTAAAGFNANIELAGNGNVVGTSGFVMSQDNTGLAQLVNRPATSFNIGSGGSITLSPGNTPRISITAAGQTTIYDPLNAINALKNAATYDTGTFTGTLTGCTTSPTATFNWSRSGNQVTIELPILSAVSNTTSCSITGLPAALVPVRSFYQFVGTLQDNGSANFSGMANISGTTILLFIANVTGTRLNYTSAGFTAANAKGIGNTGQSLTYNLT